MTKIMSQRAPLVYFYPLQQTQNLMKSIDWLTPISQRTGRVLSVVALALVAFACSDDSVAPSGPGADEAARKNKAISSLNTNSASSSSTTSADGYCIVVENVPGTPCWKYTITRKEGAKAISHFILDLNNCPNPAVTPLSIDNILNATVNGQAAILESSEGETGCEITSTSFVKFDDLPDAEVYVIEFCLNASYGNFLETTAWIKAGQSCHSYVVQGPCCPL